MKRGDLSLVVGNHALAKRLSEISGDVCTKGRGKQRACVCEENTIAHKTCALVKVLVLASFTYLNF